MDWECWKYCKKKQFWATSKSQSLCFPNLQALLHLYGAKTTSISSGLSVVTWPAANIWRLMSEMVTWPSEKVTWPAANIWCLTSEMVNLPAANIWYLMSWHLTLPSSASWKYLTSALCRLYCSKYSLLDHTISFIRGVLWGLVLECASESEGKLGITVPISKSKKLETHLLLTLLQ